MRAVLKINISIAILFVIGYLLSKIGAPYLCYFIGPLFFLLPGLNIAWIFEQITQTRQGMLRICLYAFLFSFTIMPFVVYLFSFIFNNFANEAITLSVWGGIWLASFLILSIISRKAEKTVTFFTIKPLIKDRILIISIVIFLAFYLISSFSYRFIPEQDAYLYLIKIADIVKNPYKLDDMRPIYLALLWSLNIITRLPYYFISKYVLSALGIVFVLILNKISAQYIKNFYLRIIANLSFLSFPIFASELFYGRPQNVLMIVFPVILYLLGTLIKERSNHKNAYWLFIIALSIGTGLKVHELFFSLGIVFLFALFFFFKEKIRHEPSKSIFIALFGLSYAYLVLNLFKLSDYFLNILKPFADAIIHPKFHFWFLSGYTDYFNSYVSIKGMSVILYYGYNLGFLVIVGLIIYLVNRKTIKFDSRIFSLALIGFWIFFSIAEFFPRLGFAFLPDRAWVYIAITSSILLIPILGSIKNKLLILLINVIFIGTILLCLSFIYLRQGWTTRDEYTAAHYLKKNLPSDSIVISQGSNLPMIRYFAGYKLQVPDTKFFEEGNNYANNYIANFDKYYADHENKINESEKVFSDTSNNLELLKQDPCYGSQKKCSAYPFDLNVMRYMTLRNQLGLDEKDLSSAKDNIYVVFSEQKITGYYAKYYQWQEINFAKTNINNFEEPYFTRIYQNNGIYVWKYNKIQ